MEEKDLFDMFREGSENLTEQPATDSWKRLERRLASAKETKKRRPMPLQLMVVVATVAVLLTAAAVNWVVARDHQARLRNQKEFEKLHFLVGKWSASDGKIIDELTFDLENTANLPKESKTPLQTPKILRGIKTVSFKDTPVQTDTFLLENKGRQIVFIVKNQVYELKNVNNSAFLFIAADGSVVRLRQGSDDRFTLSFGEGQIFLYRK
jgi:type II secretory pathway pseudopilin PulG